jgi:hypothetical protein
LQKYALVQRGPTLSTIFQAARETLFIKRPKVSSAQNERLGHIGVALDGVTPDFDGMYVVEHFSCRLRTF